MKKFTGYFLVLKAVFEYTRDMLEERGELHESGTADLILPERTGVKVYILRVFSMLADSKGKILRIFRE